MVHTKGKQTLNGKKSVEQRMIARGQSRGENKSEGDCAQTIRKGRGEGRGEEKKKEDRSSTFREKKIREGAEPVEGHGARSAGSKRGQEATDSTGVEIKNSRGTEINELRRDGKERTHGG